MSVKLLGLLGKYMQWGQKSFLLDLHEVHRNERTEMKGNMHSESKAKVFLWKDVSSYLTFSCILCVFHFPFSTSYLLTWYLLNLKMSIVYFLPRCVLACDRPNDKRKLTLPPQQMNHLYLTVSFLSSNLINLKTTIRADY